MRQFLCGHILASSLAAILMGCGGNDDRSSKSESSSEKAEPRESGGKHATGSFKSLARFELMNHQSDVSFTYANGEDAGFVSILESLGGGVAIFDFDVDGLDDVFCPGGGSFTEERNIVGRKSALFCGLGDWRFASIAANARIEHSRFYSHGASVSDFDNDGFADVLLTGYGGLQLFHNLGDGTFEEVAAASQLTDTSWSSSAAWGDINGDGRLDVYIAHYVDWSFDNDPHCFESGSRRREVCSPQKFAALPDTLYVSNGDGTFRDASKECGLVADGKSLGVLMADVDLDGDVDIYVASDTTNNLLYRNNGRGKFEEVGVASGAAVDNAAMPNGSMGIDLGDFDLDGRPDLWVANFERESFGLYRNEGDCFFRHVSQSKQVMSVGPNYVGWGTAFLDFDCDGDEDLVVMNGHVVRYPRNAPVKQRPLLFENDRGMRVVNVADQAGPFLSQSHHGRGLACGDLDNDGDVDLVVSRNNEPVAFLSNTAKHEHHWIEVSLIGTVSPRDPIGAVVEIKTEAGKTLTRHRKGGAGYASSSAGRLHFGVGDGRVIKRLTVNWPSGTRQVLENVATNQHLRVVEPFPPESSIRPVGIQTIQTSP
ncbi:MAG: CRTAC1 family protein [Planctomycetota bacterium]|nr:CRTAC1 family protein [Planctomycetota bacterium]